MQAMRIYCINRDCSRVKEDNVSDLMEVFCSACGTLLVSRKIKQMFIEMIHFYPTVIVDEYYHLVLTPIKENQKYLIRAVNLIQSISSLIGRFFIHEYMQASYRDKRANELIFQAVKLNTVQSWCDWLEFVTKNSASFFAFKQGRFLSVLADHHKKTYLW